MSRVRAVGGPEAVGFPRASGDEPAVIPGELIADRFSPRERG